MRERTGLLLLILPLIVLVPRAWSAAASVTDKAVCVFPLANLTPNGAQSEHQKALSDAVRQEFEAVGFHILPDDSLPAEQRA